MTFKKNNENNSEGKTPGTGAINMELFKYGSNGIKEELYRPIGIRQKEEMPRKWEVGAIIPMHKKRNKPLGRNYRGITLLNNWYKILSQILQKRMATCHDSQY